MRQFLRFFFVMIVMVLGALNVQAQGTRYCLFQSETDNSIGNSGDHAIVGATLYKSVKYNKATWTPVDSTENGGNFQLFSYPESERQDHLNEAQDNGWYKVADSFTYYQKIDGNWTEIGDKPSGDYGTYDSLTVVPSWEWRNYVAIAGPIVGYYNTTVQYDVIEWVEESYNDGDWKELATLYEAGHDMSAETPETEGKYATVGGHTYVKEEGQWKSDVVIATSWDETTGTLTVGTDETKTVAELMEDYDITTDDVLTVNFPDGSVYDKVTGTFTPASNNTSNLQQQLEDAGFTITSISLGKYVSIVDGKTVLTIPADEVGDVVTGTPSTSTKLTQAEKNALAAATHLVVIGNLSDNDWNGLNTNLDNVSTLDLQNAMISQNCKLNGKFSDNLVNLTLPSDPQYTCVPVQFAYKADNLENVVFPDQITEIKPEAFFQCQALKTVTLPQNLATIGESAFYRTGLTELVLPGSLRSVGKAAFFNCADLENVEMEMLSGDCTFESDPTESESGVFGSCFQLKHITLSEKVTNISAYMFDKCSMLESIRIPSTCKTIGNNAFNICTSLHSLVIPEGVEQLGMNVFENSGLADIYVMATEESKVPKIYSMGNTWGNNGTFLNTNGEGGSLDPSDIHRDDMANNPDEKTILTWYQEEQSNGQLGLGGGNCLIRLHYPENMRYFYDGWENPLDGSTDWLQAIDPISAELAAAKTAAGTGNYISTAYAEGTTENDYRPFGNNEVGYWPIRTDFSMRLQAGYPLNYGETEPSSLGWRQLPLQTTTKPDDYIFSKEYDDTWYTMCFPWDMEDNQLFSAFNQKLEITEFVGAEVLDVTTEADRAENKESFNLIFHFDQVAKTYYMTKNHLEDGLEYERVEDYAGVDTNLNPDGKPTTRVQTITIGGNNVEKKYYTYHRVSGSEGPEYVYWPYGLPDDKNDYTAAQKEMTDRYLSILHLMVFAGHPYMIHPSIGANPINPPVKCTIVGVTKLSTDNTELAQLADDNKVTKPATTDGKAYHNPGNSLFKYGGNYTFIGNIDEYPADATLAQKRKYMTSEDNPYAYFLAVDPSSSVNDTDTSNPKYYPKYYRKSHANESQPSWSQYSAIIRPDATALEEIEQYMVLNTNAGGGASAKGVDVEFGAWEVVTPTEIRQIIVDAEEKGQEVKEINLNVVFNINGQIVRQGTTSVEGLPKGMYVVNGKKYMVK